MTQRTLSICGKCSDCFSATLKIKTGSNVESFDYDGYVHIPGQVRGDDYIEMKIDLDTGQILNWKIPSEEDINKFKEDCNDPSS